MTTATKPRDEAKPEATRPAEQSTNMAATTLTALDAAKDEAKRNEIDAEFRDAVNKASEKRTKALAKLDSKRGPGANIAEIAWNETKADEDPVYGDTTGEHRNKLAEVVRAVRETGNADVVGLEAFEARVAELLAEVKEAAGTPSKVPAEAKKNVDKGKE